MDLITAVRGGIGSAKVQVPALVRVKISPEGEESAVALGGQENLSKYVALQKLALDWCDGDRAPSQAVAIMHKADGRTTELTAADLSTLLDRLESGKSFNDFKPSSADESVILQRLECSIHHSSRYFVHFDGASGALSVTGPSGEQLSVTALPPAVAEASRDACAHLAKQYAAASQRLSTATLSLAYDASASAVGGETVVHLLDVKCATATVESGVISLAGEPSPAGSETSSRQQAPSVKGSVPPANTTTTTTTTTTRPHPSASGGKQSSRGGVGAKRTTSTSSSSTKSIGGHHRPGQQAAASSSTSAIPVDRSPSQPSPSPVPAAVPSPSDSSTIGPTLEQRLLAPVPPPESLLSADPAVVTAELCGWVAALQQAYLSSTQVAREMASDGSKQALAGIGSVQSSLEDLLVQRDTMQARLTLAEARLAASSDKDRVERERLQRLQAENSRLRDELSALAGSAPRPPTSGSVSQALSGGSASHAGRPTSTESLSRLGSTARRTGSDIIGGSGMSNASAGRPRTSSTEHTVSRLMKQPSSSSSSSSDADDTSALLLRLRQAEDDVSYLRQAMDAEVKAREASDAATNRLITSWEDERRRLMAVASGTASGGSKSTSVLTSDEAASLQRRVAELTSSLQEAKRSRDALLQQTKETLSLELRRAYDRLESLQSLHQAEVASVISSAQAQQASLANALRAEFEQQLQSALAATRGATVTTAAGMGGSLSPDAAALLTQLKVVTDDNARLRAEAAATKASLEGAAVLRTALAATQAALQDARSELGKLRPSSVPPPAGSTHFSPSPSPAPSADITANTSIPNSVAASSLAATQAGEALAVERAAHERTKAAHESAMREVRGLTARLQQQAAESSVALACATAQVRAEAAEVLSQSAASRQSDVESAVATAVQREADTWKLELHRQREADRAAAAQELASALTEQLSQTEATMRQAVAASAAQAALEAQASCDAALYEADSRHKEELQRAAMAAAASIERLTAEHSRLAAERDRALSDLSSSSREHSTAVSSLTSDWQARLTSVSSELEVTKADVSRLRAELVTSSQHHEAALAAAKASSEEAVRAALQQSEASKDSQVQAAVRACEAQWQTRLREVQTAAAAAVAAAMDVGSQELATQLSQMTARLHAVEAERDSLTALLADASARATSAEQAAATAIAEAKAKLTSERDAQVASAQAAAAARFQSDLATLRDAQDSRISSLVAELSASLEDVRSEAGKEKASALAAFARDYDAKLSALTSDHEAALAQLTAQLRSQQSKHSSDMQRMESLVTSLRGAATASGSTAMLTSLIASPSSLTIPTALASASSAAGPVFFVVPFPSPAPSYRSASAGLPLPLATPGGGRTPADPVSAAVVEARHKAELAKALQERDATWQARLDSLTADNEKAAGIMAGLLAEGEGHARSCDGLRIQLDQATSEKQAADGRVVHLTEEMARLEDELLGYRSRVGELEAAHASAVAQVHAAAAAASMALTQAQSEWEGQLKRLHASWTAERTTLMEIAEAREGATVASAVNSARSQAAESAAEELRTLTRQYESKLAQLQTLHDTEAASLRRTAASELQAALSRCEADKQTAVAAAVEQCRATTDEAMTSRMKQIEKQVTAELTAVTSAAAQAHAANITSLTQQHQAQLDQLQKEHQCALSDLQASHASAVATLQASTMPLEEVTQMRQQLEVEATSAITAHTQAAVVEVEARAAQQLGQLQSQLAEASSQQAAATSQLESLRDRLSQQESQSSAALAASTAELDATSTRLRDALEAVARLTASSEQQQTDTQQTVAAASSLEAALQELRAQSQHDLQQVRTESASTVASMAATFEQERQAWLLERADLLQRLAELQQQAEAALMEAQQRLTAAQQEAQEALASFQAQHARAMTDVTNEMQQRFESQVAEVQSALTAAADSRLTQALQQAAAERAQELSALRKEAGMQLEALENEARALHEALAAAGNEHTRAAVAAAVEAAAAQQAAALAQASAEREAALASAEERSQLELARLKADHDAAVSSLLAGHARQMTSLEEQYQMEITEAMSKARKEAAQLVQAAEDVAAATRKEALSARDSEHATLVASLQAAAADALNSLRDEQTQRLRQVEAQHLAALAAAKEAADAAVAQTKAQCDADRVAALGAAANASAAALDEALKAAAADAELRLSLLRDECQSALDTAAAVADAQRNAAVEALLADSAAERAAQAEAARQELAAALEHARASAEAALTEAILRAEQQNATALAVAEQRFAAELEATVHAERQSAAAAHASALAALRAESEALLSSIEGAMSRLRDERDVAREAQREMAEVLAGKDAVIAQKEEEIHQLKCAGALAMAQHAVAIGHVLADGRARERQMADAANEEHNATVAEWQGRLEAAATSIQIERGRVAGLTAMRTRLLDALTSFKRDALLGARAKAAELSATLAGLAASRAQLATRRDGVSAAVGEAEGGARALERELAELSRSSVIGPDGVVNAAAARRKKRLDRDLDDALARLASARKDLTELDVAGKALEERRRETEAALTNVEGELVGALLSQQRALMSVITETSSLVDQPYESQRLFESAVNSSSAMEPSLSSSGYLAIEQSQPLEQQHFATEAAGTVSMSPQSHHQGTSAASVFNGTHGNGHGTADDDDDDDGIVVE